MKRLPLAIKLAIVGVLLMIIVLPITAYVVRAGISHQQAGQQPWWQPISRGQPAFASSASSPNLASNANDTTFDTTWRSQGAPAWLAYDLSKVPTSRRSRVLVVWYNESGNYDHTLIGYPAYNIPEDYTIEVNQASSGGAPPTTGWVTMITVRTNHYHSRQHLLPMAGYNWIRMNISAIDGSNENYDADLNLDVYAADAIADDWIFYGDSITEGAWTHETINNVPSFADLIHAKVPDHYPVQESGGTGYLSSSDGAKYLKPWLALFPGTYVGLSFGTNDALGCVNPSIFYHNYVTMVQAVLNAHKIPLVPLIPWGRNTNVHQCAPPLNAEIQVLYRAFPGIVHGPDLWTFFQRHQNLISPDGIHPNDAGFAAYRQQWANAMLAEVYKGEN